MGLTWGSNQTFAWNSVEVLSILIGAGVLYLLFILVERLVPEPILPLDLFLNRGFDLSSVLSLLQMMVLFGLIIYLPLYLQGILGQSATNAGAVITPFTLSSVVGAMVGSILVTKYQKFKLICIIGASLMTLGIFLMTLMNASTNVFVAIIFMVIVGLGIGPFFSILTLTAQNSVPRSRLGVGTGAVRFFGLLGGVIGLAVIGTVVNNTLSSELASRLPVSANQLPPQLLSLATNPQALINPDYHNSVVQAVTSVNPQALGLLNQIFDTLKASFMTALQTGFILVLIISVIILIGTFFFKIKGYELLHQLA